MRSYLKFTAFAILLFLCEFSYAIGLGEAEVRSHFGTPLDLSIPVHHLGKLSGEDLRIALSTLKDDASGHPLDAMVGSRYQVDFDAATNMIRLRSDEPVMEPFLAFTLNLRWPRGFLQREYTVLLDFPALHRSAPTSRVAQLNKPASSSQQKQTTQTSNAATRPATIDPVKPARSQQELQYSATENLTSKTSAPQRRVSTSDNNFSDGQYRVSRGDSLWGLADKLSTQRDGSHAQWMAAVFEQNPKAFIANQPHLLKEAYVLTIPEQCYDARLVLEDGGKGYRIIGSKKSSPQSTAVAVADPMPKDTAATIDGSAIEVSESPLSVVESAPVYQYDGKDFVSDPLADTANEPTGTALSPYELHSLAETDASADVSPIHTDTVATQQTAQTNNTLQRVAELEKQLTNALALIEKQSQQAATQKTLPEQPIVSTASPALAELTTPAYLFRSMGWLAFGMSVVMGYMMYRDRGGPRLRLVSRDRRRKDFASMLRKNT